MIGQLCVVLPVFVSTYVVVGGRSTIQRAAAVSVLLFVSHNSTSRNAVAIDFFRIFAVLVVGLVDGFSARQLREGC